MKTMPQPPAMTILRQLRTLIEGETTRGLPDEELLKRFAARRDEVAFAALVQRHGRLVWAVCGRVLQHEQDAEDTFQATFLVLARKAASIRKREAVGSWLHGVAYRIAVRARKMARTRRAKEAMTQGKAAADPAAAASWREVQAALDEELQRLPEKYRTPFVLCCFEGKGKTEAAAELGWKEGTVSSRLARARALLRQRLARRGVSLSAVLSALALTRPAAAPAAVLTATVRSALAYVAGEANGSVSGPATALARAALRTMVVGHLQGRAVLAFLLALVATGACLLAHQTGTPQPVAQPPAALHVVAAAAPALQPQARSPRTDRYGDALPAGAIMRLGTIRFRQLYPMVHRVAFSPDGRSVAAEDGLSISLYDAATGRVRHKLAPTERYHVEDFALSKDGKFLAWAGMPIRIYDAHTGKELRQLEGSTAVTVAFSPDGKLLASSNGEDIVLWDTATYRQFRHWRGGEVDICFSPDGKRLALLGRDNAVHLWDVGSGKEVCRLAGHSIRSFAFAPDGKTLASGGMDHKVRLWDARTAKVLRVLEGPSGWVTAVAFSPDSKILASAGQDCTIRLWDVATGKLLRAWQGHPWTIRALAFSPDGKRLASGAFLGSAVRVWDVATGKELLPIAGHDGSVVSVAFCPDGKSLLSGGNDQTAFVWDVASGKARRLFGKPGRGWFHTFAFSPDGKRVATAGVGTLGVWEVSSGRELHRLGSDLDVSSSLAFSADGKRLASADESSGIIVIWDVVTGKRVGRIQAKHSVPTPLAFAPDGKTLASAANGRTAGPVICIWDVHTGKELRRFGPRRRVGTLAFSPDGRMLAVVDRDPGEMVSLWDSATGKRLRRFIPKGQDSSLTFAFSPTGRFIATAGSGGRDNTVYVWEAATGQEVCRFQGHQSGVPALAFAPDGRTLASGGGDSTVLVWDVTGRAPDGRVATVRHTPGELEIRWAELRGNDAGLAFQAIWAMVASPAQSVAFLKERLHPAAALEPQRAARLIADLDSGRFTVRDRAGRELETAGEAAEPALRKLLAGRPTPEQRRRAEHLLKRLDGWSGERLRTWRALEVLEQIGTPAARQLLAELARGVPEVRLTGEAKAALTGMDHRAHIER
jgi:RNA polymerase sigma factor (sigma-70 family)